MSRSSLRRLCLVLGLVTMAGSRLGGAESPPAMRVLIESGSQPFSFIDAKGRPNGFAVELLNGIAADQGLRLAIDTRPWQKVYADFLQGQGDILGLVAWSEERAGRMDFSLPFAKLVGGLYRYRDHPEIRTRADLAGNVWP